MPLDDVDLASKSFHELYTMRAKGSQSKAAQNLLGPFEHRALARESVADEPLKALSYGVLVPAYTAAKILGVTKSRSDPSLNEMMQGAIGIGEGLRQAYRERKKK